MDTAIAREGGIDQFGEVLTVGPKSGEGGHPPPPPPHPTTSYKTTQQQTHTTKKKTQQTIYEKNYSHWKADSSFVVFSPLIFCSH